MLVRLTCSFYVHRKTLQPIIPFYFEETLDVNSQSMSGLAKDEIALNDLTHEQLKYKLVTALEFIWSFLYLALSFV